MSVISIRKYLTSTTILGQTTVRHASDSAWRLSVLRRPIFAQSCNTTHNYRLGHVNTEFAVRLASVLSRVLVSTSWTAHISTAHNSFFKHHHRTTIDITGILHVLTINVVSSAELQFTNELNLQSTRYNLMHVNCTQPFFFLLHVKIHLGHAVSQLVETLWYKTDSHGFDALCSHWEWNSSRTMALALTHPLTQMSTKSTSCEVKAA
jgi:hypothetical protein